MIQCLECGTWFTPDRITQILCGDPECARLRKLHQTKEAQVAQRTAVTEETECPICKKWFMPKGNRTVNCSPECTKESTRLNLLRKPYNKVSRKGAHRKVGQIEIPQKYLVRGYISSECIDSQISNGFPGGGI